MSGVSNSALAGRTIFEIAFQVSPIILQNGIANFMGGYLPIVVLTEGLSVVNGLITGNLPNGLDEFFAQFTPLPGANLVRNSVGKYPFANQSVAANAIIREPKTLAMRMIAPARGDGGYPVKLATMTALRLAIEQHTALGGTFVVLTPAAIFNPALLLDIESIDSSGSQVQAEWLWQFEIPLISLSSAQTALNSLTNMLQSQSQVTNFSWSGAANSFGNPASGSTILPGVSPIPTGSSQIFTSALPQPVYAQPLAAP